MRFFRALKVGLFAIAVAFPASALGSSAIGSTIDSSDVTRLSGADRYETATAISRRSFPDPDMVFLASGEDFPDALSGGPAAARAGAPVLLTKRSVLPASTTSELARTAPAKIFVLGGSGSVADSVAAAAGLRGGQVIRLAGVDRYATAVAISKQFWKSSKVVYLATGRGFADALSGGTLAAKHGAPVLLADGNSLPAVVANELKRLSPSKVVLLGGSSVLTSNISTAVKSALPSAAVSRLAGTDRYGTSAAIASAGWSASSRTFFSNGSNFPDALAAVPAIAANNAPLLLTKSSCMPAVTAATATQLGSIVKTLLGGLAVLSNTGASKTCATTTPPTSSPPPTNSESADQPCGPTIYKVDGGRWTCTFSDDFSGSTLDSSKWMVGETAKTGFTTGFTATGGCYFDSPTNVAVSGGALHLSSQVEAEPFVCKSPYGDFTTNQTAGTVLSYGKFAQTYGRFEFRAKFPNTAAFADSALWMYPQNPAYGRWPNSGEIDVAEWFGTGSANHVYPSLHYAGETGSTGQNCVVKNASTAFHTYALIWRSTEMSFYYDGQLCFQHAWAPNSPLSVPQPFDQAFDLVMTQTGAEGQPAGTRFTMDIDWVRAWK